MIADPCESYEVLHTDLEICVLTLFIMISFVS